MKDSRSILLKRLMTVSFFCAITCASAVVEGQLPISNNDTGSMVVLPLRLLSFDAKNVKENSVLLEWKTIGENNTDHFEIQRSTNGYTFIKAGSLKAKADVLFHSYQFTDHRPGAGNNYYRLLMYDLDGSIQYSATEVIKVASMKRLSVTPNLVSNSGEFTIYWKSIAVVPATVTICDALGRPIFKRKLEPSGKAVIAVRNWPRGVYHVVLDNGQNQEIGRLLVEN